MKIHMILVLILLSSPMVLADVQGNGRLKIIAPGGVYVNENASLMIQLLDGDSNFLPGMENSINITIRRNLTYLVHDAHPHELNLGQAIYEYNFTAHQVGEYTVYVSYQGLVDMTVFLSKFDVPDNLTEQQARIERTLWVEHDEREGMLRQTVYQIASLGDTYQNLTTRQEEFSVAVALNDEIQNSAMQLLFYCLLFGAILTISSIAYTRPKTVLVKRKAFKK
jgi:hypothetical protein